MKRKRNEELESIKDDIDSAISDLEAAKISIDLLTENDDDSVFSFDCPPALEELLSYCRIRGETMTVEQVEAALKGVSFAKLLVMN